MIGLLFSNSSKTITPVTLNSTNEELQMRVDSLADDEAYVYRDLKGCYSRRWIAETLFISKTRLNRTIRELCRKLGVDGVKPMLRIYGRLKDTLPEPVDIKEIDEYVDRRMEKEIQAMEEQKSSRLRDSLKF